MENSEQGSVDPGSMLRAAREAQGVSAREMADRLNWMPTYVDAIENNQFEVLRGRAFVRGYLRTYGKMLGIAEGDLLAALDAMGMEEEKPVTSSRSTLEVPLLQRPGVGIGLGVAAALSLILLLWLWQGEEEELVVASPVETPLQTPQQTLKDTPQEPSEELAQEPSQESLQELPEEFSETLPEEPLSEVKEESVGEARNEAVAEREPVEIEDRAPQSAPAETVVPQALAMDVASVETGDLYLRFSGDCWIEVRDASEALIYADLRRDGDELSLDGQPPFTILVGDARRVDLQYRGEPFEIKTRPGRVIARFTVGE